MDDIPMDDDVPLYVPEEFETEHLDDARRHVAETHGGRGFAGWATSAFTPGTAFTARRPGARIAVLAHAVAVVLLLSITLATGTWAVGLAVAAIITMSLAAVLRLLRVIEEGRVRQGLEPRV